MMNWIRVARKPKAKLSVVASGTRMDVALLVQFFGGSGLPGKQIVVS